MRQVKPVFALLVLGCLAAPGRLRATEIATLSAMQEGGAPAQSQAFTGAKTDGGAVVVPAGKQPVLDAGRGPSVVKKAGPEKKAVPDACADGKAPDCGSRKTSGFEKFVGVYASVAGAFWLTMGGMALASGGLTLGAAIPIVAGAAAIVFGIGVLRGKFKLG